MKVSFELSFRPSALIRAAEDVVVAGAGKVGDVGRAARNEYRARQLAKAAELTTKLQTAESADDCLLIQMRLRELLAAKAKAA